MITKVFLKLTSYPPFKRLFWPPIYNFLARRLPQTQWQFMNHGYVPAPDSPEKELSLPDHYALQRYPLQMYHYLAELGPITGKKVLEVGSGRGGGANYLFQTQAPTAYTGLDCAEAAINFSREHFQSEGLSFTTGNAEHLPFENEQFDIVINLESSRHYGSFRNFILEVARVLKPGGKLLLADWRMTAELDALYQDLKASGLQLKQEEDISGNVLESLDRLYELYLPEVERKVPRYFRRYFWEFAAGKGSVNYNDLKKGTRKYLRMVLEKPL